MYFCWGCLFAKHNTEYPAKAVHCNEKCECECHDEGGF